MESYSTVSEALNALKIRGYTRDFNVKPNGTCLVCHHSGNMLSPEDFAIDEIHRFEGMTDPGDEMILYAISSESLKVRGVLLSAYGVYQDPATALIVNKLIVDPTKLPL